MWVGEDIKEEAFPGGARGNHADESHSKEPTISSNTSISWIDQRHTRARAEVHNLSQAKETKDRNAHMLRNLKCNTHT